MTNQEIAKTFWRLADLMEIKGDNPFKINSFRKAARVLENITEDIESICQEGRLQKVPGIGKGIAERISQLVNTGQCQDYEELKKTIPSGLLEVLSIPEVGPKTVQLVWKKLNITTLNQLEEAVKKHKLRDLFRMGEKTEKNILRGIEFLSRRKGRLLLGDAYPLAEQVVNALKGHPQVQKISPAGSLRRYKETIGDIDILVTSSHPQEVMDTFVALPQVKEVLARGPTKSSVLTNLNIQMDLRVVEKESFGAALQYFTGSKEHNIKLREMARGKGLKISEYGVFKGEKKKVAGGEEEEVYAALNLPWIPPELRENLGEIEAAKGGRLPQLVELSELKGDLHIHSNFSDGACSLLELVEKAKKKGYQYIAVTDHSQSLKIASGLSEERLLKQIEEIKKINKRLFNFKILSGAEVDIKADGSLDYPDEVLRRLDLVAAAVHLGFKQTKEAMTERIIKAMRNENVDVIAHPTGRLINQRDEYKLDLERLFEVAKETKTALEINAYPERLDLRDIHCKRAKEYGVKLTISTDAHQESQLDFIKYGVATARRGWLEKEDILNTKDVEELLRWLKGR